MKKRKSKSIYIDEDDGCPCNDCLNKDGCDAWEMQFCCTYCHWCGYEQCDDCDPMDI